MKNRFAVAVLFLLTAVSGCGPGQDPSTSAADADNHDVDPALERYVAAVAASQRAGEFQVSSALLDSIQARWPNDVRLSFLRGSQFEATGFTAKAMQEYERAINVNPKFPGAWHNLGALQAREHSYRDALSSFRRAATLEPTAAAFQGVGSAYLELGRADSAVSAFRRALEIDEQRAGVRVALAAALDKQGDVDGAAKVLRTCAATMTDTECSKEYALTLFKLGSVAAALDSLTKVAEVRPWDKEVYFVQSQALSQLGQEAAADRARARFEQVDELDRQIFRLQERVALSPEALRDRFELADLYRKVGRPIEAARALFPALAIAPNNLNIRNNIGLLLLEGGDAGGAAGQFRRVLAADSTNAVAAANLRKAERVAEGK